MFMSQVYARLWISALYRRAAGPGRGHRRQQVGHRDRLGQVQVEAAAAGQGTDFAVAPCGQGDDIDVFQQNVTTRAKFQRRLVPLIYNIYDEKGIC